MNWIRVDSGERPDKKEKRILVCIDGTVETGGFIGNSFWIPAYLFDKGFRQKDITHWAHLPEPPLSDAEHHETASKGTEYSYKKQGLANHNQMTGKEKIKQMLDSGEFAEKVVDFGMCPRALSLKNNCTWKTSDDLTVSGCRNCWRKALESEVE